MNGVSPGQLKARFLQKLNITNRSTDFLVTDTGVGGSLLGAGHVCSHDLGDVTPALVTRAPESMGTT